MNDEMFRLCLIDFMNKDLLNDFVNKVFKYHLKDGQYIYMQYKIVNNNIVLNIYDNSINNRFKAYIFTEEKILSDDNNVYYINIDDCYKMYKKKETRNKINLIGALLREKDNNEKKKIINYIDNSDIKNILLKHLTV